MKTFEEDKELRTLIKGMKPESPGFDFSARVMNRIFAEQQALEQVKALPVLGRGFWIIVALFVLLMVILAWLSTSGADANGQLTNLLNTPSLTEGYQNVFGKLTGVPLSIAGILLASSLLVFIDRFLNLKSRIVS